MKAEITLDRKKYNGCGLLYGFLSTYGRILDKRSLVTRDKALIKFYHYYILETILIEVNNSY